MAAAAASVEAKSSHVFGELKEQVLALPPFVGATGKPYLNYKQDSENWDLSKISLRASVPKKEPKKQKTEAEAQAQEEPKKPKKQLYNVLYDGKPLRVQFNWLKINHVETHGPFKTVLSPLKAAAAMPEAFDEKMSVMLLHALEGVRETVIERLATMTGAPAICTKFLEKPKDARFGPSVAFSYHKDATVRRAKVADVHVYGETLSSTVEKSILKGAIHAPLARLQVSAPEGENGMVWFNFLADPSVVIGKPEMLKDSEERTQAWLEAARAHLSEEEFRKALPEFAGKPAPKKRASPKKAEVAEAGPASIPAPVADKPKRKRKTKAEREAENAEKAEHEAMLKASGYVTAAEFSEHEGDE